MSRQNLIETRDSLRKSLAELRVRLAAVTAEIHIWDAAIMEAEEQRKRGEYEARALKAAELKRAGKTRAEIGEAIGRSKNSATMWANRGERIMRRREIVRDDE